VTFKPSRSTVDENKPWFLHSISNWDTNYLKTVSNTSTGQCVKCRQWNAHHRHVTGIPCKRERESPFHYGIIWGRERLWSNEGEKYNIFRLNAETWTKCHVSKHLEGSCSDEPAVITSRQRGNVGYEQQIGSTFRTRAMGKPPGHKAKR
jgi:hypothetical protein